MLTNLNYVLCGIIIILGFSFLLGSYNEGSYDHPLLVHNFINPRKRSLGQVNIFCTCLSFCSRGAGGGHAGYIPRTRGTPQDPLAQGADTPHAVHAGRYRRQVGSTHPTGMHTYFRDD